MGLALPQMSKGGSGFDHTKASHLHDLEGMAMSGHSLWRQEGESI